MRFEVELVIGRMLRLFGERSVRPVEEREQGDACKDETGKGGNNADHRVSLTFVRRLKEIGCRDQVAGWVFSPSTAFLSDPSTASVIE